MVRIIKRKVVLRAAQLVASRAPLGEWINSDRRNEVVHGLLPTKLESVDVAHDFWSDWLGRATARPRLIVVADVPVLYLLSVGANVSRG